ncbi:serine protease [Maioricimonas sp. JC845]|uniref:trypsin-like serine peptidase n=1 Tax=Maioricimonas sp. JC845 TaxID=3232138 RepID=UPI00345A2865
MVPKPVALPRPRRVEAAAAAPAEGLVDARSRLKDMLRRREALAYELELHDAEIERLAIESICGDTDDTQDVELYDGTLGVDRQFVDDHERPVGQLQWLDDLSRRFNRPGDSPGNVAGVRWGSGALIAEDMFLTAGHCFDRFGGGWQRPQRDGVTVQSDEIARLMRINFNYQIDGTTQSVRPGDPFPVEELLEYRLGGLDFAIIRAGRNQAGQQPGDVYGHYGLSPSDLTIQGAMLCLIQHPAGRPKRIEAGPLHQNLAGRISYDSLDTQGGSSGSLILDDTGKVVGVHTNGGCSRFSGANFGVAIGAVRNASSVIA